MSRPRFDVPPELTDLLLEFTVRVLLEQPVDILDYAVNYFSKLRDERRQNSWQSESQTSVASEHDDAILSDEEEPLPKFPNRYTRRKSVFAEQYNPEEDEDEADKTIYPKTDEQRQRLGDAVRNILLFRSLDLQQMQEVLDAMFERKVKPGDVVIRQGDDGDNFYVIESGIYNIYVGSGNESPGKMVGKYNNTGSFGELALMYNMPRAATIEAASEGSLWAMNRQTFRRIVLKSAFKKRKEYEQLLESVPMLQTLEAYERMNLCDALMPKSYKDGELIIKQGDEGDAMYFVEEGTVKITMVQETNGVEKGEEKEIALLKKGQYFGELALVTHKPRAASVYAVGNVKLAFLDVHAFERLLGPCMAIMRRSIDHYKKQVIELFGSEANVTDVR